MSKVNIRRLFRNLIIEERDLVQQRRVLNKKIYTARQSRKAYENVIINEGL